MLLKHFVSSGEMITISISGIFYPAQRSPLPPPRCSVECSVSLHSFLVYMTHRERKTCIHFVACVGMNKYTLIVQGVRENILKSHLRERLKQRKVASEPKIANTYLILSLPQYVNRESSDKIACYFHIISVLNI